MTVPRPRETSHGPGPGAVALDLLIVFSPLLLMDLLGSGLEEGTLVAGLLGTLSIIVSMILATVMLRRSGSGWADMGMRRQRNWPLTIALAFIVFVATLVIGTALQLLVMELMPEVEEPDYTRFEVLRGNLPMLLLGLVSVWVTAAFGEEMLVRGFMMNRLAGLFGGTRTAWVLSLAVSSVLFGLMHLYQGPVGVVLTGIAGFLLGAAYLLVRRNLWVTILAHGLVDTLAFVGFYLGLIRAGGS
jgi:membrane protease YdiL (CAAX protease family)